MRNKYENIFSYINATSSSIEKVILDYGLPYDLKNKNVVNISLYTSLNLMTNSNINKTNLIGFLVYHKLKDKLVTSTYKLDNNEFKLVESLSTESYFLSSNDIINIGIILSEDKLIVNTISIIDFGQLGNPIASMNKLQNNIDNQIKIIENSNSNVPPGNWGEENPHECLSPCPYKTSSFCVGKESQLGGEGWICTILFDLDAEENKCMKSDADAAYTVNYLSTYQLNAQNNKIRSFRDNYLNNSEKGQDYIQKFYYISTRLHDSIDLALSVELITCLMNDIFPIIDNLENPSDTSLTLYNSTRANNIISVLILVKNKLPASADKALIDSLIDDVNFYKNKSIGFVDQNYNDL